MEEYETKNKYQILNITRSQDSLYVSADKFDDGVMFLLLPSLILDIKQKSATTILTSQFVTKDKIPLTNELIVRVTYKFYDELPIVQNGNNRVKIQNYEDLLAIFDTSIGVFRGILSEWLRGSRLEHPLPPVNIEEFLKELRISFSK